MQVGLHQFKSHSIEWLLEAVHSGDHSRSSLARQLCEQEQWRNANGEYCITQAHGALVKISKRLGFALPQVVRTDRSLWSGEIQVSGELQHLGKVELELIETLEQHRQWRAMIECHHYRGWKKVPGNQLHYWLKSSRYGILGGLSFQAASWHQRARDEYIGWSQRARVEHMDEVIHNGRFLILPGVRGCRDWPASLCGRQLIKWWMIGNECMGVGCCWRIVMWAVSIRVPVIARRDGVWRANPVVYHRLVGERVWRWTKRRYGCIR